MLTALLSRADVSRHTQALHLLRELRDALAAGRLGPSDELQLPAGATGLLGLARVGVLAGIPAYTVSVRSGGAAPPATPRAVIQLHDLATGKLLALMDGGQLLSVCASLVSAVAADALARPEARHVAILGSGPAATGALKALRLVRSLERVWVYEADPVKSFELAMHLQSSLAMAVQSTESAEDAVAEADLVVLTGEVRLPVDAVKAGAHVTVLGARAFPQCPLPLDTVERARRFCDEPSPAQTWGAPFHAELGAVLGGTATGRGGPEELTLFVSVDPAAFELVAAWHVYQGARGDEGLPRLEFETSR